MLHFCLYIATRAVSAIAVLSRSAFVLLFDYSLLRTSRACLLESFLFVHLLFFFFRRILAVISYLSRFVFGDIPLRFLAVTRSM